MTTTRTTARDRGEWQGMNWIRQNKRLAIYIRDGLACCWCGHAVEQGASLSLDHVVPHSHGGRNETSNLITSCERCNKSRGPRSVRAFARAVAAYLDHGLQSGEIERHVRAAQRRSLAGPLTEAKALLARRGTAARVLATMTKI